MKVTIIIPVFKVENYLEKCLNSVVSQTYKDLEIILVNDGSPDNCPKICDEWAKKDKRIKVIHKVNGGISSARNAGLMAASGDFVCFVDSDDFVEPDYVYAMVEKQKNNDADWVFCGKNTIKNDKVFADDFARYLNKSNEEVLSEMIHSWDFGVVWNKLYKRDLIKEQFDENIKFVEDLPFNIAYFRNVKNFEIVCEPLYNYIKSRAGSLTSISQKFTFESLLETHKKMLKVLEEKGFISVIPHQNAAFLKSFINLIKPYIETPLDKQKKAEIKSYLETEGVRAALKNCEPLGMKEKTFVYFLRRKKISALVFLTKLQMKMWGGVR